MLRIAADEKSGTSNARNGQGPGEVQAALLPAVTRDGRALVGDLVNASVQLMSAEG